MSHARLHRLKIAATTAGLFVLIAAGAIDAHVLKDFGPYSVALGWVTEPTYVGQVNAIQVVIKDKQGKAITDVPDGDLKLVVSAGGQTSAELSLNNKFDADTGLGVPGDYEVPLTPTVPGDYTFHLTGAIHGQAIDETATSSDSTFDSAVEATDIEFPTKLPSLSEVVTRLDRIDSRLAASPGPGAGASAAPSDATTGLSDAASAAQATATQARDAASMSLLVGVVLGGLGILLGVTSLWLILRTRRRA